MIAHIAAILLGFFALFGLIVSVSRVIGKLEKHTIKWLGRYFARKEDDDS